MNALLLVLSASLAFAGPGQPVLRGTVKETLDAGRYTYILISTAKGDRWAAVVKTALKAGSPVAVVQDTVMENFESKTLGRVFDRVVFGFLAGGGTGDPHAGLKAKQAAAAGPVKPAARAEGPEGRTIAELYAGKAALQGKTVAVRGTVVKLTRQVMGTNWLHLRDGSGTAGAKDDDVAVTSDDPAELGAVVVARGTLTLDKDVGAGYFFPLLIEKAALSAR